MSRRTLLLIASIALFVMVAGAVSAVAATRSDRGATAEATSTTEATPTTSLGTTTSTELPASLSDDPTLDELLAMAEDLGRNLAEEEGWDYDEYKEELDRATSAGLDEVKPWFQEQGVDGVFEMTTIMMDYAESFNELLGEEIIVAASPQSTLFFADAIKIADTLEWQYSESGENCESFDTWLENTAKVSTEAWSQYYPTRDAEAYGVIQSIVAFDLLNPNADSYPTSMRCLNDTLDAVVNEG